MAVKKIFVAAAILLCVLIGANLPPAAAHERFALEVLYLVNAERAKAGVPPLKLSDDLQRAASIRAREIVRQFSHTRPNGQRFSSLIQDNGYYRCGENIAAGYASAEETVNQWMQSPGHRANILRPDYTELGVGYAYESGSSWHHYWVQIFRRPMPVAVYRR